MSKETTVTDLEVAKKLINIHQSAMDRKIEFNLSFEYVKKMLEYKTCYYTNVPFTDDGPNARSFDRIDSDKGYVEGNVVACTVDINGKKSNLTFDEISCLYHKLVKIKKNMGEQVNNMPGHRNPPPPPPADRVIREGKPPIKSKKRVTKEE
jgi:hypothetical protein